MHRAFYCLRLMPTKQDGLFRHKLVAEGLAAQVLFDPGRVDLHIAHQGHWRWSRMVSDTLESRDVDRPNLDPPQPVHEPNASTGERIHGRGGPELTEEQSTKWTSDRESVLCASAGMRPRRSGRRRQDPLAGCVEGRLLVDGATSCNRTIVVHTLIAVHLDEGAVGVGSVHDRIAIRIAGSSTRSSSAEKQRRAGTSQRETCTATL